MQKYRTTNQCLGPMLYRARLKLHFAPLLALIDTKQRAPAIPARRVLVRAYTGITINRINNRRHGTQDYMRTRYMHDMPPLSR